MAIRLRRHCLLMPINIFGLVLSYIAWPSGKQVWWAGTWLPGWEIVFFPMPHLAFGLKYSPFQIASSAFGHPWSLTVFVPRGIRQGLACVGSFAFHSWIPRCEKPSTPSASSTRQSSSAVTLLPAVQSDTLQALFDPSFAFIQHVMKEGFLPHDQPEW